jgi:hypothetical protein
MLLFFTVIRWICITDMVLNIFIALSFLGLLCKISTFSIFVIASVCICVCVRLNDTPDRCCITNWNAAHVVTRTWLLGDTSMFKMYTQSNSRHIIMNTSNNNEYHNILNWYQSENIYFHSTQNHLIFPYILFRDLKDYKLCLHMILWSFNISLCLTCVWNCLSLSLAFVWENKVTKRRGRVITIQESPGSNLSPETGYHSWNCFCNFPLPL